MQLKSRKYIVILGSIMSGLGKGILTASICKLLQTKGYNAIPLKFDGYLNVDCGTMNPFRHGEVFVLDDGSEVDMDFGTYERFLNISLTKFSSITGGKIFNHLIRKEREGRFLGRDVQIVPHLTDELKDWIRRLGDETNADFVVIEVGGTVGDIENSYFIEALRQLSFEEKHFLAIQLTYVPSVNPGEQKTKPTQHANRIIQSLGIKPEIIVCREDEPLTEDARKKIAMFCNVSPEHVFDDPTLKTIYELPQILNEQGIYSVIAKYFGLDPTPPILKEWNDRVEAIIKDPVRKSRIALIGKYTSVADAYASVCEAVKHAGAHLNVETHIDFIDAEKIEREGTDILNGYTGIIVPGGFGNRGVEGKILAIKYARENNIPFLGLCLGMQLMVVEYARNVIGLKGAHSTEFDPQTPYPVIDILPEQRNVIDKGGTMRLGAYTSVIKEGSLVYKYYNSTLISERHRHRYEVNPAYYEVLEKNGLIISGKSVTNNVAEFIEWPNRLGIGTQAHPEFKSRLETPAPLFIFLVDKSTCRI